jgi:hypothetical protein
VLVLQFSETLNTFATDNANAYRPAPIVKVPAKGKNRKPATPSSDL